VTCSVYNPAVILAGHLERIKEKNFVPEGKSVLSCLHNTRTASFYAVGWNTIVSFVYT
jgi:hypothetical protein